MRITDLLLFYPRDIPQMNSVTERWVTSLKEKLMFILLMTSFSVDLVVSCLLCCLFAQSTKTAFGYMSPYECVFGTAPDLKWLRMCIKISMTNRLPSRIYINVQQNTYYGVIVSVQVMFKVYLTHNAWMMKTVSSTRRLPC